MTAPEIVAAALDLALVVVAILALITARRHLSAARTSNETTQEANRVAAQAAAENSRQQQFDSRARTRPYVSAQIVPGLLGGHCLDLRLTNTGQTTARGLTLTSEWPADPDRTTRQLMAMFGAPRDLAPQSSYRVAWRIQHEMTDEPEGMGIAGHVKMHYGSDDPAAPPYTDELRFDFETWGPQPLPSVPTSVPKDTLNNIDLAVRQVSLGLAELRR